MGQLDYINEKDIDPTYIRIKNCPVCNCADLYYCGAEKNMEETHITEIINECNVCGEIFSTVYNEHKIIMENKNISHDPVKRNIYLRKQKLEKLLNTTPRLE